ncbi:hypothetical protein T4D_3850 [Trichinella pseudospiralis]|nr:hypothetical protein T4D_3850 [Trichinella pseudospiralis]
MHFLTILHVVLGDWLVPFALGAANWRKSIFVCCRGKIGKMKDAEVKISPTKTAQCRHAAEAGSWRFHAVTSEWTTTTCNNRPFN